MGGGFQESETGSKPLYLPDGRPSYNKTPGTPVPSFCTLIEEGLPVLRRKDDLSRRPRGDYRVRPPWARRKCPRGPSGLFSCLLTNPVLGTSMFRTGVPPTTPWVTKIPKTYLYLPLTPRSPCSTRGGVVYPRPTMTTTETASKPPGVGSGPLKTLPCPGDVQRLPQT